MERVDGESSGLTTALDLVVPGVIASTVCEQQLPRLTQVAVLAQLPYSDADLPLNNSLKT